MLELETANRPRTGRTGRASAGRRTRVRGFSFGALEAPGVLGILNVTPDSFSDGGRHLDPSAAVTHGAEMFAAGAAIVDVGGESTRPHAAPVSAEEEIRRVEPVIERLRERGMLSIDTTKAAVAERALAAGAAIVNDVSAGLVDPRILEVAASAGAGVILMHRKGTPDTMDRLARYRDVVSEVKAFLAERIEAALRAGVPERAIAVDPGIGFAKTAAHSVTMLAHLDEIAALGFPVVVGVSKKRFLGRILDAPVEHRLEGTIAASLVAVGAGASWVRVHDVQPMVRALRVATAIWKAAES